MEQLQSVLQIGMRVWVRALDDALEQRYASRIEDMTDRWLVVQRPTDEHRSLPIGRGSPVELTLAITGQPGKDGQYRARTVVLGVLTDQRVPFLQLAWPENWERVQHREYVRVPVSLPVRLRVMEEDDEGPGDSAVEEAWVEGIMRDLSGGGCQVAVPLALAPRQEVEVEFRLPSRAFVLPAEVQRVDVSPDDHRLRIVGLAFTDIREPTREEIIRFTFQRQIELRKKGLA